LKEELEATLNFLRRPTISIATLEPQVIIISNLKEEVEIIREPIVQEQPKLVHASRPREEEELQ
jgi:hypothetical protein